MNIRSSLLMLGALAGTSAMMACTRSPQPISAVEPSSKPVAAVAATSSDALPRVVMHKSPSCQCCALWVKHLRDAGFVVDVRNEDNLSPIKERVGVPYGKGSCHTAEIDDYFVEGHVPAEDIKRLLAQRPDAKGLVLPGMPMGSPGMEIPDGRTQPYTVGLVGRDGMTTDYAEH